MMSFAVMLERLQGLFWASIAAKVALFTACFTFTIAIVCMSAMQIEGVILGVDWCKISIIHRS